jgi:hypothetical protein
MLQGSLYLHNIHITKIILAGKQLDSQFCTQCILVTQYRMSYRRQSFIALFMFCWPCISIYARNETNLTHYWSSVYSVTILLRVSGLLVALHQELTTYICICTYTWWNPKCSGLTAVKIIKLTTRSIGRHHPRSSSLPHVDTGPTRPNCEFRVLLRRFAATLARRDLAASSWQRPVSHFRTHPAVSGEIRMAWSPTHRTPLI